MTWVTWSLVRWSRSKSGSYSSGFPALILSLSQTQLHQSKLWSLWHDLWVILSSLCSEKYELVGRLLKPGEEVCDLNQLFQTESNKLTLHISGAQLQRRRVWWRRGRCSRGREENPVKSFPLGQKWKLLFQASENPISVMLSTVGLGSIFFRHESSHVTYVWYVTDKGCHFEGMLNTTNIFVHSLINRRALGLGLSVVFQLYLELGII